LFKDSIMLGAAVLLHEVAFGWPRGIEYSNPRRRLPDTIGIKDLKTFRCKIHNERFGIVPFLGWITANWILAVLRPERHPMMNWPEGHDQYTTIVRSKPS
jgi:hypothetical protein